MCFSASCLEADCAKALPRHPVTLPPVPQLSRTASLTPWKGRYDCWKRREKGLTGSQHPAGKDLLVFLMSLKVIHLFNINKLIRWSLGHFSLCKISVQPFWNDTLIFIHISRLFSFHHASAPVFGKVPYRLLWLLSCIFALCQYFWGGVPEALCVGLTLPCL